MSGRGGGIARVFIFSSSMEPLLYFERAGALPWIMMK